MSSSRIIYIYIYIITTETKVAPIWDPIKKTFVALMTVSDFMECIRISYSKGVSFSEIGSRSILDVLNLQDIKLIKHNQFLCVDADSSVYQMCYSLHTLNFDYIPIIDSNELNLIGILSYIDILYLLAHCAQQFPIVSNISINQIITLNSMTSSSVLQTNSNPNNILNVSSNITPNTLLVDILMLLHTHNLSEIPLLDNTGRVLGIYIFIFIYVIYSCIHVYIIL
jgi:CBS domain-containing protein